VKMLKKLLKKMKYQYYLLLGKYFSEGLENIKLKTYMKYALGGIFLFLIQVLIVLFLTQVANVDFMFAYAVALVLYVIMAFVYHNEFTFKKMINVRKEAFRKFLVYMGISSSMSYTIVFILTSVFVWAYLPAVITVAIFMSIINFFFNACWVF